LIDKTWQFGSRLSSERPLLIFHDLISPDSGESPRG